MNKQQMNTVQIMNKISYYNSKELHCEGASERAYGRPSQNEEDDDDDEEEDYQRIQLENDRNDYGDNEEATNIKQKSFEQKYQIQ